MMAKPNEKHKLLNIASFKLGSSIWDPKYTTFWAKKGVEGWGWDREEWVKGEGTPPPPPRFN